MGDGTAQGGGRVPPNDLDAEGSVLSAILLNAAALDEIPFFEAKHFYADANRRIFEAILELRETGRPIDIVTVRGVLSDHEKLQAVGGSPYLAMLADATPAAFNIAAHAQRVVEKWELRQVIHAAMTIAAEGYSDVGSVEEWKQSVDARMFAITRSQSREDRLVVLADATRETIEKMVERSQRKGVVLTGVTTGLPTLDARLGGLEAKKLYVVAARPGMGKTAIATGMALACARRPDPKNEPDRLGDGVIFISVEMPRHQIASRVLSQISQIDSVKILRGHLTREEWARVYETYEKIRKLPIVIEDSSDHTPSSIRAAFRQGQRRIWDRFGKNVKVKLCAIDYLQLLNAIGVSDNREQQIGAISRATKAMAKDEDIAVLDLAQVNRECEKRVDKRPMLSDLRESGAIEADADSVMFVYREDYYRPKDQPKDDSAEIIVSKLRDNGGPGIVRVMFDPKTTSFYEKSKQADYDQLGDMFDDYLPGQYGEPGGSHLPHWQDGDDD